MRASTERYGPKRKKKMSPKFPGGLILDGVVSMCKWKMLLGLLFCYGSLSGSPVLAQPVIGRGVTGGSLGSGPGNIEYGYKFTTSVDQDVTAFGVYAGPSGETGTAAVGIWNAGGTEVDSGTVDISRGFSDGALTYSAVAPFLLAPGTYFIGEFGNGDNFPIGGTENPATGITIIEDTFASVEGDPTVSQGADYRINSVDFLIGPLGGLGTPEIDARASGLPIAFILCGLLMVGERRTRTGEPVSLPRETTNAGWRDAGADVKPGAVGVGRAGDGQTPRLFAGVKARLEQLRNTAMANPKPVDRFCQTGNRDEDVDIQLQNPWLWLGPKVG